MKNILNNVSDMSNSIFSANMIIFKIRNRMIGTTYADEYKNDLEKLAMDLDDMSLSIKKIIRELKVDE